MGVNPLTDLLDMRGPEFLGVYAAMVLFGWIVMAYVRWETRCAEPDEHDGTLHPYEVAYLEGGAPAVVVAAVASLTRRGLLEGLAGSVRLASELPADAHPVDRAIASACLAGRERTAGPDAVREAALPVAGQVADRLVHERLVVGERATWKMRFAVALVLFALLGIGLAKAAIGWYRGRPVGLPILMTLANLPFIPAALRAIRCTSRGEKLAERLRAESAPRGRAAGEA